MANQIKIVQGEHVRHGCEIRAALDYVYGEWGEPCPLCVINIPENRYTFISEYRKCHIEPEISLNPNAITIPVIFQSDSYKERVKNNPAYENRPLILINNEKLASVDAVFYASVIVHELSHCRDYVQLLPRFQEKYEINLLDAKKNECNNVWNSYIGGYFSCYSEMHAKYLQEKYCITHEYEEGHYDAFFFVEKSKRRSSRPRKTGLHESIYGIEDVENEDDYYYASFCAGQLRCWEDLFADNCRALKEVNRVKEYFLKEHNCRSIIQDMYEAFDWNVMLNKCDQIRQEQQQEASQESSQHKTRPDTSSNVSAE